jgi:patatin-like phospholipase/acyl hydrolase
LNKPSIITSYDTNKRKCVLFKQHHAIKNESKNFYIREIIKASSSAPIYFKPSKIFSLSGEEYSLIDGGIYANNPAMCGFVEIDKLFKKEDGSNYGLKDIQILSIGSGTYKRKYKWLDIRNWGILQWIIPFIEMSMSAVNEITNYQFKRMFMLENVSENYLRINVNLEESDCKIDNVEKSNIDKLKIIGDELFLINKDIIKKFMNR